MKHRAIKNRIDELRQLLDKIETEIDLGNYNVWDLICDIEFREDDIRRAVSRELKRKEAKE